MKTRPEGLPRAWLLGLLAATLPAAAADTIRGRVVEAGKPENGIAGVSISMNESPGQKLVGRGLTDTAGRYAINVQASSKATIMVSFSKLGYGPRPRPPHIVTDRKGEQPPVLLFPDDADNQYYQAVAQYISTNPQARSAYFPAVTALPAREKATVLNTLKLHDVKAYEEFAVADKAYLSTQDLFRKFGANSSGTNDFQAVLTYPTPGAASTLWLFGSVPSANDRNALEQMARAVDGVTKVRNDVKVIR